MNSALRQRLETQLAEVDEAISNITKGGQSASFSSAGGSQSVTQANLSDLLKTRENLEKRLYGGGISARSAVGR